MFNALKYKNLTFDILVRNFELLKNFQLTIGFPELQT